MASEVGCIALVVDAKEEAVVFYERYGFEAFEALGGASNMRPLPILMFLPLPGIPLPRVEPDDEPPFPVTRPAETSGRSLHRAPPRGHEV